MFDTFLRKLRLIVEDGTLRMRILFVLGALVLVPILATVLQPLLKKLRAGNRRRGNQHGEMTSVVQETVSGIRLVKSFGAESYEERRFQEASNRYAKSTVRLTRLSYLAPPVTEIVGTCMAVLLLWVGARQVLMDRAMAGADLIAFLLYALRLLQPLKQLSQMPTTAQSSLAAAERRMACMLELGPRYLHSTGQLHKGGPPIGCFLQVIDETGLARRGLLVRHLVLPDGLAGTKEIMNFLAREISPETYVNVMGQYRPCGRASDHPALRKFLTGLEQRRQPEEDLPLAPAHGLAVLLRASLHTLQGILARSGCNCASLTQSTRPTPILSPCSPLPQTKDPRR